MHHCHKREFLLKFGKDRLRWLQWLYEAKKRYGLVIGRQIRKNAKGFEFREPQPVYNAFLRSKKDDIEDENLWFWNV